MFDVIVNPHAARLRDGSPLRGVIDAMGPFARVHVTRDTGELERVAKRIVREPKQGPVLLAGGDGTTMHGISALFRASEDRLPDIGILPGGTVNTVLANIAGRPARARYFRNLAREVAEGRAVRVRHATMRIDVDARATYVGFIVGAGLVSSFFEHYERGGAKGEGAAAATVLRVFASAMVGGPFARSILEPARYLIGVDGAAETPKDLSLLIASVLGDLGLSMRVTPRAAERSDTFQLVATTLAPRALSLRVMDVLRGRPFVMAHDPEGIDRLAHYVELGLPAERPRFVLDGDSVWARRIRISVGPRITLLLPRDTARASFSV